jgi:hypothetical protein
MLRGAPTWDAPIAVISPSLNFSHMNARHNRRADRKFADVQFTKPQAHDQVYILFTFFNKNMPNIVSKMLITLQKFGM